MLCFCSSEAESSHVRNVPGRQILQCNTCRMESISMGTVLGKIGDNTE